MLACGVHRDDRVRGDLEDGSEPGFALREGRLGGPARPDARRDVDDRREHLGAVGGVHRCEADLDRELRAVLPSPGEIEPDAHRPRGPMCHEAVAVSDVTLGDPFRQEPLEHLPEHLAASIPEGRLGPRVDVDDPGLGVDRDDRVRRGLEDGQMRRRRLSWRRRPRRLHIVRQDSPLRWGQRAAEKHARCQPIINPSLPDPCS